MKHALDKSMASLSTCHLGPCFERQSCLKTYTICCRPYGHYFVSGGHDNTARLWSTDHYQPLRLFAGHLADIDVGVHSLHSSLQIKLLLIMLVVAGIVVWRTFGGIPSSLNLLA